MTRLSIPFLLVVALCVLAGRQAAGQEVPAVPTAEKAAKPPGVPQVVPALDETEVQRLAESLFAYVSEKGGDRRSAFKKEKAFADFMKSLDKARKDHEPAEVLAMVGSWEEVFRRAAAEARTSRGEGRGRVKDGYHSERLREGKSIGFDFAIYLPTNYDPKVAWPLVIALHDKGSDGKKYLEEVWMRLPKEARDHFVLLAPTLGDKTVGRRSADQARIGPFPDVLRMLNVYWPLADVLGEYNIDTNRIFLDGTGTGAELAFYLAALRSKDFAAVAIRSAVPPRAPLLANMGNVPSRFHLRTDGPLAGADAGVIRTQMDQMKSQHGLDLEITEYPPLEDKDSVRRKELGSQTVDPVHDATPAIAEYFAGRTRDPYPNRISFLTPYGAVYKQMPWLRLIRYDAHDAEGVVARISARADRPTNTIEVTCENVSDFVVSLNDRILDLDKPVKIVVNGQKVLEQKIDRSLDEMLDVFSKNQLDPVVVVTANLTVGVPDPVQEGEAGPEAPKSGDAGGEVPKDGGDAGKGDAGGEVPKGGGDAGKGGAGG